MRKCAFPSNKHETIPSSVLPDNEHGGSLAFHEGLFLWGHRRVIDPEIIQVPLPLRKKGKKNVVLPRSRLRKIKQRPVVSCFPELQKELRVIKYERRRTDASHNEQEVVRLDCQMPQEGGGLTLHHYIFTSSPLDFSFTSVHWPRVSVNT